MSGHSKWSSIKHKKGKEDAKRGQVFTRLIREISTATRVGGKDPDSNARLRQAVSSARAANMPGENIERAIRKGAGEEAGQVFDEITFEGYGPAGVALLVETMTDNRNRTVSEVRHVFDKYNGKMGETGCVAWMFDKKGVIAIAQADVAEDKVMEMALDAGADDVSADGDTWIVTTAFTDYEKVLKAFEAAGIKPASSEISRVPQTTVKLSGRDAEKMMKLMDQLEDLDDAQNVWANFDISDEDLEKLSA